MRDLIVLRPTPWAAGVEPVVRRVSDVAVYDDLISVVTSEDPAAILPSSPSAGAVFDVSAVTEQG